MCGVAGWLGPSVNNKDIIKEMMRSLSHRGPDAAELREWSTGTLIHTRLSIIDTSSAGNQPLSNEDQTVWIVFNGEIYNHHEIRQDLQRKGHVFIGHSDSEILPHLYEEEGGDLFTKIKGMFSIAVLDLKKRKLLLARDRFGIKPLFYAATKDRFAFASEINALLQSPDVDIQPDVQAIYDFSSLHYIPAPLSFYKGIRSVQPGEMLEAQLEPAEISWNSRFYHQWRIAPDDSISLSQALDRTEELLSESVRRQLESDVPLGTLLSGGIDSSLVSVYAQEALERQLQTFNVAFPDPKYDETWAAVAVAQQIGSDHTTLQMSDTKGSWDHVTDLLKHAGQPFADVSIFGVNAVCKLMRQRITVALSGDGGDEGFGGYIHFSLLPQFLKWQSLPSCIQAPALKTLRMMNRTSIADRLSEMTTKSDDAIVQAIYNSARHNMNPALCREADLLPAQRWFEPRLEITLDRGCSREERLSARFTEMDLRFILPNDYLFKVDTASMKESLEVRVPFLDEDLFEYGLTLPHRLKCEGKRSKRLLRSIASEKLPRSVSEKPKKGFGVPVDLWVEEDFRQNLKEYLLDDSSKLSEYFNPSAYAPIINAFCSKTQYPGLSRSGLHQKIIMLLSVELALNKRPKHVEDAVSLSR